MQTYRLIFSTPENPQPKIIYRGQASSLRNAMINLMAPYGKPGCKYEEKDGRGILRRGDKATWIVECMDGMPLDAAQMCRAAGKAKVARIALDDTPTHQTKRSVPRIDLSTVSAEASLTKPVTKRKIARIVL